MTVSGTKKELKVTLKSKKRLVLSFYSLLFTLLPIGLVATSSYGASLIGCEINESGASNCLILGIDLGNFLYAMFVSGWLGIITFPIGGLATITFFVLALNSWNDTEILR